MNEDPTPATCHFCGCIRSKNDARTWWHFTGGGYSDLKGLACPECNDRIEAMTTEQRTALATSRDVAEALSYEGDDVETTMRKLNQIWDSQP